MELRKIIENLFCCLVKFRFSDLFSTKIVIILPATLLKMRLSSDSFRTVFLTKSLFEDSFDCYFPDGRSYRDGAHTSVYAYWLMIIEFCLSFLLLVFSMSTRKMGQILNSLIPENTYQKRTPYLDTFHAVNYIIAEY